MNLTKDQELAFASLDDCEQRFALAILAGKSGVEAILAGYGTESKLRHETVRNRPGVRHFLTMMQSAYISDAIMTRTEAMERLSEVARAKVTDVVEVRKVNWGTDQEPDFQVTWTLKDNVEDMPAVKSIGSSSMGPKVEMHSPLIALKQLAELAGWVEPEGVNARGTLIEGQVVDVSKLSDATLHELVLTHYERVEEKCDSTE
jgi:phage terminase small subunit